jgi:hypothetical protein
MVVTRTRTVYVNYKKNNCFFYAEMTEAFLVVVAVTKYFYV